MNSSTYVYIRARLRLALREYKMHITEMTIECLRVWSGSWRGGHQDATRVCSCTTRRVSFRPPGLPRFYRPGGSYIPLNVFVASIRSRRSRQGSLSSLRRRGNHAKDSNDDNAAKGAAGRKCRWRGGALYSQLAVAVIDFMRVSQKKVGFNLSVNREIATLMNNNTYN